MSKRGLLVIAGLLALPGAAFAQQTDYSAGKTPAQLFSGDCSACHQSPRGLAKGRDQSSLANFLREHYTTKAETAGSLATYLLGNPGTASEPRNATGRTPRGTPASSPAAAPPPKPAEDDPFRRIFRTPVAEPDDEGAIVAPEPGEPGAKQKGKPRTAARPPAEQTARPPKDSAKEQAKEKESAKEAARPKKPESSEAAREAAKAEEAAREAAAKEAAAKAEAAKAEAAKVRAYVTGGEPAARMKESEPATPSPDRPASTPPG